MLKEPVPLYGAVPPVAETVHVNGLPAVCPVPQVTVAMKGCWTTVTCVEATALLPLWSVTVNDSVKLPLTGWVTVKFPAPWYGAVPPVAVTLQMNGLPAVMVEPPHVTLATNGCWTTVTCVEATALLPLWSLTVNDSVNVPLTGWTTVKFPVPWYGAVPPVAV